jgi:hypothetical protein
VVGVNISASIDPDSIRIERRKRESRQLHPLAEIIDTGGSANLGKSGICDEMHLCVTNDRAKAVPARRSQGGFFKIVRQLATTLGQNAD